MQNIQKQKIEHTNLAWMVTLTASLFFFYAFIQLNLFNSIDVLLMRDFHIDATQLGQLASMYFYANALFLFPAGVLLDRCSTKKLLLFAVSLTTIGTFMFGWTDQYRIAAAGRFLVGTGCSFCFLSCIRIASRWFPPHKMATVTGIIVVFAWLGGIVAQTPFAFLTQALDSWRHAVLIDGALGVIIFLAIALIVKDRPPGTLHEEQLEKQHLQDLGLWRSIKLAALNPQNWLGGLYTALMNLPVFLLGALWGIHYLVAVRHISLVEASYATSVFFLGLLFGSPAFGWFSDKIERRVIPMVVGAILSLGVILVLMYAPHLSLKMIIFLFFLIGFVSSSQVLSYPTIAELNPSYLTGTAVSIDSICIMISGFVFQPFFGWLMQRNAQHHEVIDGIVNYSAQDFNQAMLIIPIAFVMSLIITVLIQETYCKVVAQPPVLRPTSKVMK